MSHLSPNELSALLDGALEGRARERADRHLASCAACRDELAALEAQDAHLARALTHDPGETYFESFADRVTRRIESEDRDGVTAAADERPRGTGEWWSWLTSPRGLGVAGSVAAVLVVAGLVYVQREQVSGLRDAELMTRAQQSEGVDGLRSDDKAKLGASAPSEDARSSAEKRDAKDESATRADAPPFVNKRSTQEGAAGVAENAAPSAGAPVADATRLNERERRAPRGAMVEVRRTESGEEVPVTKSGPPSLQREAAPAPAPSTGAGAVTVQKPQAQVMSDRFAKQSAPNAPPVSARGGRAGEAAMSLESAADRLCGRVVDAQGRPVSGAEVALADVGHSTTADADGRFCVEASAGTHTVSVLRVGYEPLRRSVTIGGEADEQTLALRTVTTLPSPASGSNTLGFKQAPSSATLPGVRLTAGWPIGVLPDVAQAESAVELAARSKSAPRFEDAARLWERVLTRVSSPGAQLEARDRIADARFRAWELESTPARAATARVALDAFLAARPVEARAEQTRKRVERLGSR